MNKANPKHDHLLSGAFQAVQEGLRSMQLLQQQTAETHQKFLEAQTAASQALQEMMRHTQRLVESSFAADPAAHNTSSIAAAGASVAPVSQQAASAPAPDTNVGPRPAPVPAPAPAVAVALDEMPATPAPAAVEPLSTALLEIVSQLTGYPQEMLGLEMDIEADLGIDSIKRVEILSSLEENVPGLPSIAPEQMGSLRTLGQIIAHLAPRHDRAQGSPSDRAPAAPPASASTRPEKDANLERRLLEIVSQLTGYPQEMLGLEMDIEADLGIDSIKRVEILSSLEENVPGLPSIAPEQMGSLRTLGQIIAHLTSSDTDRSGDDAVDPEPETAAASSPAAAQPVRAPQPSGSATAADPIARKVVKPVPYPRGKTSPISFPPRCRFYLVAEPTELTQALEAEMAAVGLNLSLVPWSALKAPPALPQAAGVLLLADPSQKTDESQLAQAFQLAQAAAPELQASAQKGGAVFATLSFLDGAFGFKAKTLANPLQGGLAGLAKTAAIEWPQVRSLALDITPEWRDWPAIARVIVAEVLHADAQARVEIGLRPDGRWCLDMEDKPYPAGEIDLAPGDVVIYTGGAKGIGAAISQALAERCQPTLVLLGRSPAPAPEPAWLTALEREADIKQALMSHEFNGQRPSPRQLEAAYQRIRGNREIQTTLQKIRQSGGSARYYSLDIRNTQQLDALLGQIRAEIGPPRALLHGAGVLEDRLIADKSPEQFARVLGTKVSGFSALLNATREDALKYVVVFSSVAARWGNQGQVDYAMANEALNKMARTEKARRPESRVLAINWGPWQGGMVTPALEREFGRRGVSLIPLKAGAQCLLKEMQAGPASDPVEVVIGAAVNASVSEPAPARPHAEAAVSSAASLALTFKRKIDVERVPVLASHQLDGKAVVPFALLTEWMGVSALHAHPGLLLQGLDDIRLLNGVKVDGSSRLVRLFSGKALRNGSTFEVEVELRDGMVGQTEVIHSRAKALLSAALPKAPPLSAALLTSRQHYARTLDEVYERILFHGEDLRGLKEIVSLSDQGMIAKLASAPAPQEWMREPIRSRWISDPLILDAAFQMASLWSYEQRGMVSLPAYGARYRQYCQAFPPQGVTALLQVTALSRHKMCGDFTFVGPDDQIVAVLEGFEAVMDTDLYKAFKPEPTGRAA